MFSLFVQLKVRMSYFDFGMIWPGVSSASPEITFFALLNIDGLIQAVHFRNRALLKLMSLISIRLFSACSASVHLTPGAQFVERGGSAVRFGLTPERFHVPGKRKADSESVRSEAMALAALFIRPAVGESPHFSNGAPDYP
jgi:hypothetical protein